MSFSKRTILKIKLNHFCINTIIKCNKYMVNYGKL